MKVLLCSPPSHKPLLTIPDIGLGYLATALEKSGHEVTILQPELLGGGFKPIADRINDFKPQVVGFKVFSKDIVIIRKTLQDIKRLDDSIVTIIGGPHPSSSTPDELFNYFDDLDFGFIGEAEKGLPMLVDKLESQGRDFRDVPGLMFKSGDGTVANPLDNVDDLDSLGFPKWELLHPLQFRNRWLFWLKGLPAAPISTGRGCPFKCTFCAHQIVSGKKVRRRSPEMIFSEVKFLIERWGIKNFDFIDDNFITNKERVRQFCNKVIDSKLDIRWSCAGVHLKSIDAETIRLMEEAGCRAIGVGIESGNDSILEHMRKGIRTDEISEQLKVIKENSNILVMGQFILGYPVDTLDTIRQTIEFSCKVPIDLVTYYTFVPVPGSEAFRYVVDRGELKSFDWETISISRSPYSPPGIPLEKLLRMFKYAYIRFYCRPKIVWGMLKEMSYPSQLRIYWIKVKDKFLRYD